MRHTATKALMASIATMAVLVSAPATAAPVTISHTTFDSFNIGSVHGQGGWSVTNPSIDQEVVDLGGGNKALRISNKFTSGSFGDMPFAPRPGGTGNFAGESSTGALYNTFIGSFDFRSVLDVHDVGARVTISPDNGQGARQGFIALASTDSGVSVETYDVDVNGFFVGPQLLATVNFAEWNTLRYEILFIDGAFNDIATIYLNNALVATIKSWESYYANWQATLHPNGVPVQTFLFRLSGTSAPNAQGFYIDNVKVQLDNRQVPEPLTLGLLGLGLAAIAFRRHTR